MIYCGKGLGWLVTLRVLYMWFLVRVYSVRNRPGLCQLFERISGHCQESSSYYRLSSSLTDLIQKARVHQFLQKELDISQFRVLDAQRFQHAQIAVFDGHEHRTQMFQIGSAWRYTIRHDEIMQIPRKSQNYSNLHMETHPSITRSHTSSDAERRQSPRSSGTRSGQWRPFRRRRAARVRHAPCCRIVFPDSWVHVKRADFAKTRRSLQQADVWLYVQMHKMTRISENMPSQNTTPTTSSGCWTRLHIPAVHSRMSSS